MPHPLRKHRLTVIALLVAAVIPSGTTALATTNIQGRERLVKKRAVSTTPDQDPVKLTGIRTKETVHAFGRNFVAEEEWLKELSIAAENSFDKTLTYLSVDLKFIRPAEQSGEPPLVYPLRQGFKVSEISTLGFGPNHGIKPLIVKPGEITIFKILDHEYQAIRSLLKQIGYPDALQVVEVSIKEAEFSDRTSWANGVWYRPGPKNSLKNIPVTEPERMGKVERKGTNGSAFQKIGYASPPNIIQILWQEWGDLFAFNVSATKANTPLWG